MDHNGKPKTKFFLEKESHPAKVVHETAERRTARKLLEKLQEIDRKLHKW